MSFLTLSFAVYALWGLYTAFALSYVVSYLAWTIRCVDWYRKVEGTVPRTAQKVSKRVIRNAAVLNFFFYATFLTFAAAILLNILAVDNTYLYYVLAIIAAPWVIIGVLRLIIGRRAKNNDLYPTALLPRRLALNAVARRETYALGAKG